MNCLGLDFGLKHIGVAYSDGPLATPLTTVSAAKAPKILPVLVDTHHVHKIIIGQPDTSLKPEFEKFLHSLEIRNLKLEIIDETLSSHEARQKLLHTTRTRRRVKEHAAAAAVILQSWLDTNFNKY